MVSRFDGHPNAYAHQLAAGRIEDFVARQIAQEARPGAGATGPQLKFEVATRDHKAHKKGKIMVAK
jgi:hypothetical protein